MVTRVQAQLDMDEKMSDNAWPFSTARAAGRFRRCTARDDVARTQMVSSQAQSELGSRCGTWTRPPLLYCPSTISI